MRRAHGASIMCRYGWCFNVFMMVTHACGFFTEYFVLGTHSSTYLNKMKLKIIEFVI